jgi:hypothetical protein
MASTKKDYAQWLVDNQDQKGSDEWNTVAAAFKKLDAEPESAPAPTESVEPARGNIEDTLVHGATWGLSDEAAGAGASVGRFIGEYVKGAINGELPSLKEVMAASGEAYSRVSQGEREKVADFSERHPVAAIGSEVLGGAAGVRAGKALLSKTVPLATRIVKGAATGAGGGAAYGFNTGEGVSERLQRGLEGAKIGGTIGGAIPGVAAGGRKLLDLARKNPAQRAVESAAVKEQRAADKALRNPPSNEQLKVQSQAAYAEAEAAGVRVSAGRWSEVAEDIVSIAKKAPIDKGLHPRSTSVLNRIAKEMGEDKTLTQMEQYRRLLQIAAKTPDTDDARVANLMIDALDDFVDNLTPADIIFGNKSKAAASRILRQARDYWRRYSKGQTISDMMESAYDTASMFSASGLDNAIRRQFKTLIGNKNRMKRFNVQEKAAIRRVARGGPVANVLRIIGKGSVTGGLGQVAPTGLALALGGPMAAGVAAAGGTAARIASNRLTKSRADKVSRLVRGTGGATK